MSRRARAVVKKTSVKKTAPKATEPRVEKKALDRVARGERVLVRRGRKALAAVVPMEDLKALEELEDRLDVQALEEALAEPGPSIPYEEVRRKLGLS